MHSLARAAVVKALGVAAETNAIAIAIAIAAVIIDKPSHLPVRLRHALLCCWDLPSARASRAMAPPPAKPLLGC